MKLNIVLAFALACIAVTGAVFAVRAFAAPQTTCPAAGSHTITWTSIPPAPNVIETWVVWVEPPNGDSGATVYPGPKYYHMPPSGSIQYDEVGVQPPLAPRWVIFFDDNTCVEQPSGKTGTWQ